MQRIILFACLLACLLVFLSATPTFAADKKVQQPMGGIAGNHPYFYRGKTGQDYAARVGSGFRQIEFQRIRIIPSRHDHRRVFYYSPGYYWRPHGYGYYNDASFGYTRVTQVVEPRQERVIVRSVAQVQPRVPEDPWAMLAGGYYAEALGTFAMKAQQNEAGANVGYALASAFKGDHGQAAWAMRKAVESGEFAAALKQMTPLRQRLRELAGGYESDATLIRWPSDRWFLAASLHVLRGDNIAARKAIEKVDDTNEEASTAALRRMMTGR
ncbi:MAG: hypothetical protein WD768_08330 [Phycisphaeraceae bacterium]